MKKVLLYGNGPMTNRGCEAIMLGTAKILRRRLPYVHLVHAGFTSNTGYTFPPGVQHEEIMYPRRFSAWWWKRQIARIVGKGLSLNPFEKFNPFETILKKHDGIELALTLGGDNYTLEYGTSEFFFKFDDWLRTCGIPIVHWGASIGPFNKKPLLERKYARNLSQVAAIFAREPETVEYLHSIGIRENVSLMADPAFVIEPVKPTLTPQIAECLSSPCIGINISPLVGRFTQMSMRQWGAYAATVVQRVLEVTRLNVALVPHVISNDHNIHTDDEVFMRAVLQRITPNAGQQVCLMPRMWTAPNLKWVIGRMRCFIGARTHSTIAALGMGVPTISIGYSQKARGINRMVYGDLRWLVPIEKINAVHIGQMVFQMLSDEQTLKAHILRKADQFRALAYATADRIVPWLKENAYGDIHRVD